jgi:hypothetical protein
MCIILTISALPPHSISSVMKLTTSKLYFHGDAQACIMYNLFTHCTSPTESFRYPFPQHRHPHVSNAALACHTSPQIPPTYRNASCMIVAQQTLFLPHPNTTTPERQRKLLPGRKDLHVLSLRLCKVLNFCFVFLRVLSESKLPRFLGFIASNSLDQPYLEDLTCIDFCFVFGSFPSVTVDEAAEALPKCCSLPWILQ